MASRVVQAHNSTVLNNLEEGDQIEVKRGMYSHWAVYVGDGKVIHLAGEENDGLSANINSSSVFTICGSRFNKAFVRMDDFWDVVCGSMAYKNNDKDKKMSPCDAAEIVQRAVNMIGEIGYNVLWSNCEHFASLCRYGNPKSDQADKFVTWATVGSLAVGFLAFTLGAAFQKKNKEYEEEEV